MRIVQHYKRDHAGKEVFISRISPAMAKKAKENIVKTNIIPGKNRRYQAICFFCQETRMFRLNYWCDHIRTHTGEYGHTCPECCLDVNKYQHCGRTTIPIEDYSHDLFTNDFKGYICNQCNFVQLNMNNMTRHIELQHEESSVDGQYQQITLLPAYRKVYYKQITKGN